MKSDVNILMISIDRAISEDGSAVRKRIERYSTFVKGIDVFVLGAAARGDISLQNNLRIHLVSGGKLSSAWKFLRMIRKYSAENSVISTQDPFELGVLGLLASKLTGRPLHIQVHIDFMSPLFAKESCQQFFQARLAPFVIRRASSVRTVSLKIATYIKENLHVAAQKISVVPIYVDAVAVQKNAVGTDLPDLHRKFPGFKWIVLMACRFVRQKNVPLAIEAFAKFAKSHKDAGLVIVGSGPESSAIKDAVAKFGIQGSTEISPWTNSIASYMKTSDVFLMSSDYEGWGMTVLEAASLGKPVVMTDVGCAREFLVTDKNGIVVPVRDADSIARALQKYYDDRNIAAKIGLQAKHDAETYMTQEQSDSNMIASWAKALDRSN